MKAHIGGVVVYTTFHMNVHALGKTKPPSGGRTKRQFGARRNIFSRHSTTTR